MKALAAKWLCLLIIGLWPVRALAQQYEFHPPATAGDATAPAVMRDLAERILPVYMEKDTERYLANLAALQLVAGDYRAAYKTRQSLQERRLQGASSGARADKAVLYDIYARARAVEAADHVSFPQAFTQAFREIVPKLSDRDAHAVKTWLATPRSVFEGALQKAFDRWRIGNSIPEPDAVELIWTYLSFDAYRSFSPLVEALDSEDSGRRYVSDEDVVIKAPDGTEIHAFVVRPASTPAALPALLEFTLQRSRGEAEASAAHGYAGVVAYTRGKKKVRPGTVDPFRRDGENARAVVRWISKQPWSDGRVGMFGEGYSGFAAWAAAKRLPPALKAIATSTPLAPGIDFPMMGQIYRNSGYRWATALAQGDDATDGDDAKWLAIDQAWYRSGKPYPDLARRFGKRSAIFDRWLDHPSYDRYWQKMIPFGEQFAKLDIPVLTTTGYYADGAVGALHYFSQHLRHRPDAQHTLLIGPYGDRVMQDGIAPVLRGYPVDAAALIDLRELRYQWFDSVLRNGAKPPLLKDRVNYQLMGSNEWRHAPSLAEMGKGSLRFYLAGGTAAHGPHRLLTGKPAEDKFVQQTVKLSDRRDAIAPPLPDLISRSLPTDNKLSFVSEPLQQPLEFGGLLTGQLDFRPNKMDVDLYLAVYEQLAGGTYVQISEPYEFRASYARDRVHRRLLQAGVRQQLPFTSERLGSRRLAAGSRLVLVLGVNKRADRQINYGTGKAVNEEDLADARRPLKIRWYGGSYVELPVQK